MQKSDRQIIADYLNGDENAIAILVDRHLKSIFNFSHRLVGNRQDAEDATQETFVKMWRNLKKFRQSENFKTWLFTIARNTAIDSLRRKKSVAFSAFENEEGENPFAETLADIEPLPDEIFAKAEEKNILEDALTKLSSAHREVLLLHYNERFTFDEIGKILGRSLNTAKSRHRRALIELKKSLNEPKDNSAPYK